MGQQDSRGPRPQTPSVTVAQFDELKRKVLDSEKRIAELSKIVNDKNEWNNVVREWIGTKILVCFVGDEVLNGVLKSLDRYTLTIRGTFQEGERDVIIHKGAVAFIRQA